MNKNESKYFNTAKRMDDALIALLDHKDFEYITVKDVCEEAYVNRSTFYLHYTNTVDLLEEVIGGLNDSFASHFNSGDSLEKIINTNDLNNLRLVRDEYLIPYLEFIKENKKAFKAVYKNPTLFQAGQYYTKLFNYVFVPILNKYGLDSKWHGYIMEFYIKGIMAMVQKWVLDDCDIPIEEVSRFIQGLIVSDNKEDNGKS